MQRNGFEFQIAQPLWSLSCALERVNVYFQKVSAPTLDIMCAGGAFLEPLPCVEATVAAVAKGFGQQQVAPFTNRVT